jgi:hypothetical protein
MTLVLFEEVLALSVPPAKVRASQGYDSYQNEQNHKQHKKGIKKKEKTTTIKPQYTS